MQELLALQPMGSPVGSRWEGLHPITERRLSWWWRRRKKMAAVAAEPGASAAATTTAREGAELEHEVVQPAAREAQFKAEAAEHRATVMDLVRVPKNGDAAQECSVGRAEAQRRAPQEAVGSARCSPGGDRHAAEGSPGSEPDAVPKSPGCKTGTWKDLGCEEVNSSAGLTPSEGTVSEVAPRGSPPRVQLAAGSEPAAAELSTGFPEAVPAVPTETWLAAPFLSLTDMTELGRGCAALIESDLTGGTDIHPEVRVSLEPPAVEPSPERGLGSADLLQAYAMYAVPTSPRTTEHLTVAESSEERTYPEAPVDKDRIPAASDPQHFDTPPISADVQDAPLKAALAGPEDEGLRTESIAQLIPGSEVRVSLDHIIDDALVVSFRLGEKIFSGVLMDVSKRFGPYGIPVTVFPKREYRDKPETMQLKAEPFPSELEKGQEEGAPDEQRGEACQTSSVPEPEPTTTQWTLKPPPLFQEGVPYPPPLFIRDTYSQSIPQPPPRKIKRPKRKLYREEPTSIMNAIKLRPRQVLCDKCKGAVVGGDKREVRRGPGPECRAEEAKRRRGENTAGAGKRPRTEARAEGPRKQGPVVRVATTMGQVRGPSVMEDDAAAAPAVSGPRVQLNAKKVLQNKNVDHCKAREVLKMARVTHRRQRDKASAVTRTPISRTSSPQDTHQKVHFTRRLHQISGGGGTGVASSAALPPRIRIKPQRYRNEENSSSAGVALSFERGSANGGKVAGRSAPPRCASTRSSCSGPLAVAAAAENHSPPADFDTELGSLLPSEALPHPEREHSPQLKPGDPDVEADELGGQEERQGAKAGSLSMYVSLNASQPDSSSVSVCSVDSADDLKSSNSECSSTETFDLPPPGALHSPPVPSSSSIVTASSTTPSFSSSSSSLSVPKEEKKPSKPLKAAVFSKNVSKCVTADGRTICVGDIVWAKIYGFPWWPARILVITVSRKDNGLLVRQEARISWFGSPTTSFLALSQVTPFLENFQSRFDKKRKGLYRKAISEAAKAAKQLTPEVRALLTQFET
ncbi:PWWP domain-containing protein 2A [Paramormyrops kingsleyae]|uniref:PWWP domain-containing protein 2A n=1 Tax=Paramormyrops kingsleyae TaxID=1676925 RepID=UPI003B970589